MTDIRLQTLKRCKNQEHKDGAWYNAQQHFRGWHGPAGETITNIDPLELLKLKIKKIFGGN